MMTLAWIRKRVGIGGTLAALTLVMLGCGGESLLSMPSPHARYDHNRTRPLRVASRFESRRAPPAAVYRESVSGESVSGESVPAENVRAAASDPAPSPPAGVPSSELATVPSPPAAAAPGASTSPVRFRKADYAPQARRLFEVAYAHPDSSGDGLPTATLVPVYPGLPLPLSAAPVEGCDACLSDRQDLIDYLATGTGAQAGVEPPDAQGDTAAAARELAPLLDALSRADWLAAPATGLRAALTGLKVTWADGVLDARYAPAAFASVLAFEHQGFWFVLYQFPEQAAYSRLVVIPTAFRQDICRKRPGSGEGLGCQ
jgi:hypothetical protein